MLFLGLPGQLSELLELLLPVVATDTTPGSTAWTAQFERAAALRAQPLQGWTAALQRQGRELLLTLESDTPRAAGAALPAVEVFPFTEQLIETANVMEDIITLAPGASHTLGVSIASKRLSA